MAATAAPTLSAVADLARQLAEAATAALWDVPADDLDAAEVLERVADAARAAAEAIG